MLAVIVDDNKQAALDLAERLREFEDVEVGGMAINGMDGLSLVSQVQPDVLFLDVAEGRYDWKIERGRGGISVNS